MVLVTKTTSYEWDNQNGKSEVYEYDTFEARAGERFIVSGVSNSVFKASFRMKIWVNLKASIVDHVP